MILETVVLNYGLFADELRLLVAATIPPATAASAKMPIITPVPETLLFFEEELEARTDFESDSDAAEFAGAANAGATDMDATAAAIKNLPTRMPNSLFLSVVSQLPRTDVEGNWETPRPTSGSNPYVAEPI
ncbi:MAG: hypothetical protein ABIS14_07435 [Sphingomonas sp.]